MSVPEPNSRAPVIIDALTLARSGAGYDYRFQQHHFSRLSGLVMSEQPSLDVKLQFDLQRDKPIIRGQLQGTVELVCQRCMALLQYPLDEQFALWVVEAATTSSDHPDELAADHELADMEEWVADATRIDVVELVEEQIILALPLVAKHDDESVCAKLRTGKVADVGSGPEAAGWKPERKADAGETTRRPFANLRVLLNK